MSTKHLPHDGGYTRLRPANYRRFCSQPQLDRVGFTRSPKPCATAQRRPPPIAPPTFSRSSCRITPPLLDSASRQEMARPRPPRKQPCLGIVGRSRLLSL